MLSVRSLAALSLVALALGGLASAATIRGTDRADVLRGTAGPDVLDGRGGNDAIIGLAGRDLVSGGAGRDLLDGGRGSDRLVALFDRAADTVRCGPGLDLVNAGLEDRVLADCELVARQLSRDTTASREAQHETEAEPDSFAWGSTVVTVFQVGRIGGGGAAAIGFASSPDGGRTWRSGLLPGITAETTPAGPHARASDPVVAYDAAHGVWLAVTLAIAGDAFRLLVSRSRDGVVWEMPVTAAEGAPGSLDKEWIVCDTWPQSRFRGRCYLSYLDDGPRQIVTRWSADGGLAWSAPVPTSPTAPRGLDVNGAQPAVQPDGTLVVVYTDFAHPPSDFASEVVAVRSTDGGASFSPPVTVSRLALAPIPAVRAFALPSVEVDGSGRVVAAWQSCLPIEQCQASRILFSSSQDGLAWSPPRAVAPAGASEQFLPGLGADPRSGGDTGRLSLVYHALPRDCLSSPSCPGIDVFYVSSLDGGRSWSSPRRLSAQSMPLSWIARTTSGLMLGDYVSVSYAGGRAVATFVLAGEPVAGALRQAVVAAVLPRETG
ncbi:MAG: exo-alpha-sialidase [Thermoleophilia bacterium]